MAANTKYAPAPTQDPDEGTWSQPPPSYQAEATSSSSPDLFGAAPRSSEDNIPDDFKFGGSVAEATVDIRNQFIRKVYTILTAQLLVTAVVSGLSFWSTGYRQWVQGHPLMVWVSVRLGSSPPFFSSTPYSLLLFANDCVSFSYQVFGSMAFMLLTYWKRKSYPTNLLFLSIFTLFEAHAISVIVSFYKTQVVLNAVILTGGIFIFLTAFACQTKYDFTSWMPYLFGALWGLLLFGFMAAFLPYSSTAELVYGGLAALIFSGYILVDTQLVLRKHHVEEEIAAAISLYLDIINLFLAILRILNSQSNN
ncbi:transmembrane BAX inhibitor motif-containing protein [Camillea tinctor]|nr:transmembrane BAX inhibitor motif-containing protein [Camillea tinctor]